MDGGKYHKSDALFCGHCGIAITDEPQQLEEYKHSQQGRCPFRGVSMSYAAWLVFETVSAKAKAIERRCKTMKRRQQKKDVELVMLQTRLTTYEHFIDNIKECYYGQWWMVTPLEIKKRVNAAFGELKAREFCLECEFIVISRRLKTTEVIVKATEKRCKYK